MKFIADISKKTWEVIEEETFKSQRHISIGFVDNKKDQVFFDNLFFGANMKCGDKELSFSFPKNGISYISTDQKIIESFSFETKADDNWEVTVWAENSGELMTKTVNIFIEKPDKPFESWLWNDELQLWSPPIPYPKDDLKYLWNEEDKQWKIFHPES